MKLRAHHDGDGAQIDGSLARYTIHFGRDQIPQAEAFWSATVYNSDYDLVENPIGRYSLGSVDKTFHYDTDGGLTFYLQTDAPAKKQLTNWLADPARTIQSVFAGLLAGAELARSNL